MKCLACGAEMRLMDVQTDTTTVCGIERHTFRCSTCPQTAQRLMFNRPRMPIIHLPVVTRPKAPAIDLQMGRPAAGSGWVNAVEKLNSKQADLKQRTAMTVRTPDRGSAVEKVSIALKQQAVAARAAAWARTVERLRSRQMAIKQMAIKERAVPVRTVDREFDRVWYGHCPDEAAPKPVALGPVPLKDDGAT
ncbi:MAG: hypothetical protein WBW11_19340 [Pseudolabrys sp.]